MIFKLITPLYNLAVMGIVDTSISLGISAELDRLGVGAAKKTGIFLPGADISHASVLVAGLSSKYKWGLLDEKDFEKGKIFVLQVGQWGLSIKGGQRLTIVLQQEQNGVRGALVSKSVMGQWYDWGANQKNLERAVDFLENHLNTRGNGYLLQVPQFAPKKPIIHRNSLILLVIIVIGGSAAEKLYVYYLQQKALVEMKRVYNQTVQQINADSQDLKSWANSGNYITVPNASSTTPTTNCIEYTNNGSMGTCKMPDTSGWRTYQNDNYGFKFKYPEDWIILFDDRDTGNLKHVIVSKEGYAVEMFVKSQNYSSGLIEDRYVNRYRTFYFDDSKAWIDKSPYVFNEDKSGTYRFNIIFPTPYNDPEGIYNLSFTDSIKHNNVYYSFIYTLPMKTNDTNYNEGIITEADQILSTFNFTTIGTQTYQNDNYGFEFQYPKNYLAEDGGETTSLPRDGEVVARFVGNPDEILLPM